jgi:hypothetical protein
MPARADEGQFRDATYPADSNRQNGPDSAPHDEALPHDLSLMPAGLEVSHESGLEPAQAGLEVSQPGLHVAGSPLIPDGILPHQPEKTTKPKICGLGKRKFQALLVLVVIGLVVGLAAGLTVGKRHSHKSGQPAAATYLSKEGAWNGSGFALTDQGYIFHVYFQHHSGDLTWMYHNMEWYGDDQYVIATDARNNTPVSAVTYVSNATEFVHVFCTFELFPWWSEEPERLVLMLCVDIDSDNVVRQLVSNNGTDGAWRRGPLEKANLHAYDADRVAMQACWAGLSGNIAMRLWFASDNDTLEEYLWVDRGDNDNRTSYDDWVWQKSRPGYDPFAGIGCHNGGPVYSGGPDLPVIVTLLNSQSELEICTMSTAEALAQLEQVNAISAWTKSKYISIVSASESIRFIVLLTFRKEPQIFLNLITSGPPSSPIFYSCKDETPMPYLRTISAGQTGILSSQRTVAALWKTIRGFLQLTSMS